MPLPTIHRHATATITIDQAEARISIDFIDLDRVAFDAVPPEGPERHHPSPPAYEEFWSRSAARTYTIRLYVHTTEPPAANQPANDYMQRWIASGKQGEPEDYMTPAEREAWENAS